MPHSPEEFSLIRRLPPYVFNIVNELKSKARAKSEEIIDLDMGNQYKPTPEHIVTKVTEASCEPTTPIY